ncbi:uncharacterized protein LOC129117677 [Agelaius phoeniceus]|uniref:uncharacterized protein LOC129117677 n=1 Tax=Agelaius phoeniceus TaxID=39638 RepID=UPI004054D7FB
MMTPHIVQGQYSKLCMSSARVLKVELLLWIFTPSGFLITAARRGHQDSCQDRSNLWMKIMLNGGHKLLQLQNNQENNKEDIDLYDTRDPVPELRWRCPTKVLEGV